MSYLAKRVQASSRVSLGSVGEEGESVFMPFLEGGIGGFGAIVGVEEFFSPPLKVTPKLFLQNPSWAFGNKDLFDGFRQATHVRI